MSLKIRKLYKYQFRQFAYCHVALLVVVLQSTAMARLPFEGMLWFFLPASLVVINDSFAYFCGRALGHRFISAPLIDLSPKKTWEGFIGAFVCTVVWAFWVSEGGRREG